LNIIKIHFERVQIYYIHPYRFVKGASFIATEGATDFVENQNIFCCKIGP